MRDFPEKMLRGGAGETEGHRSCWKHPRGAEAHCVPRDTLGHGRSLHELTHGESRISGLWFGWIIKGNHGLQNPCTCKDIEQALPLPPPLYT